MNIDLTSQLEALSGGVDPCQALLSDLEDWVERLEDALDGEPPADPEEARRVLGNLAADMRAALAAAGREGP